MQCSRMTTWSTKRNLACHSLTNALRGALCRKAGSVPLNLNVRFHMKAHWLLLLLLLPLKSNLQTLYKCTFGSATAYQSSPCSSGKQQVACANSHGHTIFSESKKKEECNESQDYSAGSYYSGSLSTSSSISRSIARKPGTDIQVKAYSRKDGTYVPAHTRAAPKRK